MNDTDWTKPNEETDYFMILTIPWTTDKKGSMSATAHMVVIYWHRHCPGEFSNLIYPWPRKSHDLSHAWLCNAIAWESMIYSCIYKRQFAKNGPLNKCVHSHYMLILCTTSFTGILLIARLIRPIDNSSHKTHEKIREMRLLLWVSNWFDNAKTYIVFPKTVIPQH